VCDIEIFFHLTLIYQYYIKGARIARPTEEQGPQLSEAGKVIDIAINNIDEKYPDILIDNPPPTVCCSCFRCYKGIFA